MAYLRIISAYVSMPGPRHGCWHAGAEQDVPNLGQVTQVRGQPVPVRRPSAAQVDDPADPGRAGKAGKGLRRSAVGRLEPGPKPRAWIRQYATSIPAGARRRKAGSRTSA
jgi:hypothetical protein